MKTLQSREHTIDWESASNWSGWSVLPTEYKFKPQDEQDDEDGEDLAELPINISNAWSAFNVTKFAIVMSWMILID